jgi:hypothetical protein
MDMALVMGVFSTLGLGVVLKWSRGYLIIVLCVRHFTESGRRCAMKTKLLRKVRREARYIFYNRLFSYATTNGEVTRLKYDPDYTWAIRWIMGERLDNRNDKERIISEICRLLWGRSGRKYWHKKLKKEARDGEAAM